MQSPPSWFQVALETTEASPPHLQLSLPLSPSLSLPLSPSLPPPLSPSLSLSLFHFFLEKNFFSAFLSFLGGSDGAVEGGGGGGRLWALAPPEDSAGPSPSWVRAAWPMAAPQRWSSSCRGRSQGTAGQFSSVQFSSVQFRQKLKSSQSRKVKSIKI